MTPTTAIFKKELRQHGILAVAAVIICLLIQVIYYWLIRQSGFPCYNFGTFISTALSVTMFYAGVAAAISYSTEHANKTFTFLRRLPVSHTMLAAGKIGWALCGTGLVLIINLLLCAFWFLLLKDVAGFQISDISNNINNELKGGGLILLIIAKVFVWGLLWTTLCRNPLNAVAATGGSIIGITLGFLWACFVLESEFGIVIPTDINMGMIYNTAEIILVAPLALWRIFRWFDIEAKESLTARLLSHKFVLARYPKRVQSPFLALVHHHIRHASVVYYLGIFSFALFSLGILFMYCYLPDDAARREYTDTWWWAWGAISSVFCIFVLWGTIFGHDLKNDSYLFLSRMGVHEGKFWWSRILPAMVLYVPVIISAAIAFWMNAGIHHNALSMETWTLFWTKIAPGGLVVWLAPAALGTYLSISSRSQIISCVLTGICWYALILWMAFFTIQFDCSPWWTTLPICIAPFVASRLRARYWFKETFTWRSRAVPLIPLFVTVFAILVALPLVRIYSVPNVSWSQIDAFFDQADFGDNIRVPEKRKALIQYIATHGTVPVEYERWLAETGRYTQECELNVFSGCTTEEFALLNYVWQRNRYAQIFSIKCWREIETKGAGNYESRFRWFLYMPWERVRMEQILRARIVAELVESGYLQDKRAVAIRDWFERPAMFSYTIDRDLWCAKIHANMYEDTMSYRQLRHVFLAIDKWYNEHGCTLPESLEELIEEGYLAAFPEHPFTGELMQYHRDAPPPEDVVSASVSPSAHIVGVPQEWWTQPGVLRDPHEGVRASATKAFREDGGTYLRLDNLVWVIVRSQETEDRIQEDIRP